MLDFSTCRFILWLGDCYCISAASRGYFLRRSMSMMMVVVVIMAELTMRESTLVSIHGGWGSMTVYLRALSRCHPPHTTYYSQKKWLLHFDIKCMPGLIELW